MNNIIIYQEIRRVYFEQSFRMFSSTTKIDYIKVDCIIGGLQTGSLTNRFNCFHISAACHRWHLTNRTMQGVDISPQQTNKLTRHMQREPESTGQKERLLVEYERTR